MLFDHGRRESQVFAEICDSLIEAADGYMIHPLAGFGSSRMNNAIAPAFDVSHSRPLRRMQKLWMRYLELLESDLSTQIFDNVKNLLVCALLFAAGTDVLRGKHDPFMGLWGYSLAGWGLIALSTMLMVLNVSDGIRRLAKLRYHLLLQLSLILAYALIAARVVEIVWGFRSL